MGFVFTNEEPKPEMVTITLEEFNELKLAMQFLEDQGHIKEFMMYQGLLSQDNLSSEDEDIIFIDAQ